MVDRPSVLKLQWLSLTHQSTHLAATHYLPQVYHVLNDEIKAFHNNENPCKMVTHIEALMQPHAVLGQV